MAQDHFRQDPSSPVPGRHGAQPGSKPTAKRFRQGAAPKSSRGTGTPRHAAPSVGQSAPATGGVGRHGRPAGAPKAAPQRLGSHREAPATSGTPRPRRQVQDQQAAVTSDDAPRAIGVDPSATGAFQTLGSGQGAVIHDRSSSAEAASAARSNMHGVSGRLAKGHRPQVKDHEPRVSHVGRKALIGLCIAAAVVIVAVVVVVVMVLESPSTSAPSTGQQRVEQTQAEVGKGVLYDGYTYDTSQGSDGAYVFTRTAQGSSDPLELFKLEGTPVAVVLYNGVFLIPENVDGQWKVMAYTLGDGSVATELQDSNGQPVGGQGTITGAKLDGTNLTLDFQDAPSQSFSVE